MGVSTLRQATSVILLILFWLMSFESAGAQSLPVPALTGRVVDEARVISYDVQSKLEAKLGQFESKTKRQLVIVTLPTLRGYSIEQWGTALINQWGIGRAGHDDGVVLVVAPNERALRIAVGDGLRGTLSDDVAAQIIRGTIVPRFKSGDLEGGIVSGADAIIAVLSGGEVEAGGSFSFSNLINWREDAETIIFIIFVVFAVGFHFFRRWLGTNDEGYSRRRGWYSSNTWDNDSDDGWRSSGGSSSGFSGGGGSSSGGGASGRW